MLPFNMGMGGGAVDTGDIPASLRFRSAASAYLSRTFGAPTDNKKWTWSGWVKRGALPAAAYNLLSGGSGGSNDASLMLDGNGSLWLYYWTGSYVFSLTAAAFSRDPTSHVHLVVSYDSTQAQTGHSASDSRVRFYLNGVQVSSTGTLPSQNYASNQINAAVGHRLGYTVASSYPFDGYLSRIAFVDGQALTPSSFGYLNTEINEWVSKSQSAVKAVVDAGGTNSFMLDFDDATSLTTLGYDKSSKGNNWTLNNFSLTAGTSYDRMLDVPGNSFATFNPLTPPSAGGAAAYSAGNLQVTTTTTGAWTQGGIQATIFARNQKVYAEFIWTSGSYGFVGVQSASSPYDARWYYYDGHKYTNSTDNGAYGATWTLNDVIGVALDTVSGTVEFFKNGVSQGVAYSNLGAASTWTFVVEDGSSSANAALAAMYGQAPLHASATYHSAAGGYFRYAPPSGYKALCQRNMPDPAILNPSTGFKITLATEDNIYSAVASARSGWTDYVDILKNRAASESWAWQFSHDSANEYAISNATKTYQAKRTQSGSNNWVGYSIRIGATYGTASGSVSHTNGAATTITHNLGTSRQMIFLFPRAAGSVVPVFHVDCAAGSLLDLCNNAGQAASTAITSVGSNSFQIGSGQATGAYDYLVISEKTGLVKLHKHDGNSSSDGPCVNTNGRPAFEMLKNISGVNQWNSWDARRETYNVMQTILISNSTNAEVTNYHIDFLASAFKPRAGAGFAMNDSGSSYVGVCYLDAASKYALAR